MDETPPEMTKPRNNSIGGAADRTKSAGWHDPSFWIENLLARLGQIAGIGGISVGIYLILYLEFVRQKFLPRLQQVQAYNLLLLFMLFTFAIAVIGVVVWSSRRKENRLIAIVVIVFALVMSGFGVSVVNQAKAKVEKKTESQITASPIEFKVTHGRKTIGPGWDEVAIYGASITLQMKNLGDKPATITAADINLRSSDLQSIGTGQLHIKDRIVAAQSTNVLQLETYFTPAIPNGFPAKIVYPMDGSHVFGPVVTAELNLVIRSSDDRDEHKVISFPAAPADLTPSP